MFSAFSAFSLYESIQKEENSDVVVHDGYEYHNNGVNLTNKDLLETSESVHAKNGGKESAIENLYNQYCSSGLLMCPGCRLEPWSTRFSQGRILHFFIHRTSAHFVCCNLSHAATLAYNRRVLDAAREIEQKLAPFQEAAESKFSYTKAPLTWFRSLLPLIIIFGASLIFFF